MSGTEVGTLDALAQACAEMGRFTEALETIEFVVTFAGQAGQPDAVAELQNRQKLFQAQRPYRNSYTNLLGPGVP